MSSLNTLAFRHYTRIAYEYSVVAVKALHQRLHRCNKFYLSCNVVSGCSPTPLLLLHPSDEQDSCQAILQYLLSRGDCYIADPGTEEWVTLYTYRNSLPCFPNHSRRRIRMYISLRRLRRPDAEAWARLSLSRCPATARQALLIWLLSVLLRRPTELGTKQEGQHNRLLFAAKC